MSSLNSKTPEFVYRRVSPAQMSNSPGPVKPDLFELRKWNGTYEDGLSVFNADQVSPHQVFQQDIDHYRQEAESTESTGDFARKKLEQYPDVETMIRKGWCLIKIPTPWLLERGFTLSETEANGHLLILGEPDRFMEYQLEFVRLIADRGAVLLKGEECLQK